MRTVGHLRGIERKKLLIRVFQQTSHIKTFQLLAFVKDLLKSVWAGKSLEILSAQFNLFFF